MRLERIGEDSALIARIEAINVAAFPEIERISIKNFLKMSRKGQLEIAAIFEDFSALSTGGAADKNHAAASEHSSAAAHNLNGEELVGFFVYRTEQTYKRAISHHKQPPPRLNADKILRSKAHNSAEFESAGDEISGGEEGGIFYVAYLSIDAKFRGLGIGSRLLALIVTQNPRAQIVLDIEPPYEDAPNLAQRLRRIEFYGRHGFRRCGKFFNYAGLSFEILAKPPLSAPQQGFDVASFVKFIGAGNKFRFKITDAPLYKN